VESQESWKGPPGGWKKSRDLNITISSSRENVDLDLEDLWCPENITSP